MHIVDTHLHLWDPQRLRYEWLEGPLAARMGPDELAVSLKHLDAEVSFIFVQAECVPEHALEEVVWVSQLADTLPIRGIVARAMLNEGHRTIEMLDTLTTFPLVRGVRHLLQGEPVGTATSEAFLAGARELAARSLTFDACVNSVAQLRDVVALAEAVPELRIVLDHLGKPEIGTAAAPLAPSAEWLDAIAALAAHPNVWCKISGLPAESGGDWSAEQVTPFLDAAAEAFGADRLMFGSDWPVSAVRDGRVDPAAYAQWAACVAQWSSAHDPLAERRSNMASEGAYDYS